MIAIPALAVGAWASHSPGTYWFAMLYFCIAVLMPVLYVVWAVRTGQISDFHMSNRRERVAPFVVSLVCGLSAWILLVAMGSPRDFVALVLAMLLQTLLLFLITLFWQVSVHTAVTGSRLDRDPFGGRAAAMPLIGLVPLVAGTALLGPPYRGPNGRGRVRGSILLRGALRPARHRLVGVRQKCRSRPSISRRAMMAKIRLAHSVYQTQRAQNRLWARCLERHSTSGQS